MRSTAIVLLLTILVIAEAKHHAFSKLMFASVGEYKL